MSYSRCLSQSKSCRMSIFGSCEQTWRQRRARRRKDHHAYHECTSRQHKNGFHLISFDSLIRYSSLSRKVSIPGSIPFFSSTPVMMLLSKYSSNDASMSTVIQSTSAIYTIQTVHHTPKNHHTQTVRYPLDDSPYSNQSTILERSTTIQTVRHTPKARAKTIALSNTIMSRYFLYI
jgi:hypothetical protein